MSGIMVRPKETACADDKSRRPCVSVGFWARTMPLYRLHLHLAAASLVAVLLPGCRGNFDSSEAALAQAQAALDTTLDAWNRQEPPEKFAGVDPDWKAGYRLLSFLTAEAKYVGSTPDRVRCRVALALKDRQGKRLDKEVFYLIQLGDTITIRRDEKKIDY
jgi:hypothetical protein